MTLFLLMNFLEANLELLHKEIFFLICCLIYRNYRNDENIKLFYHLIYSRKSLNKSNEN